MACRESLNSIVNTFSLEETCVKTSQYSELHLSQLWNILETSNSGTRTAG